MHQQLHVGAARYTSTLIRRAHRVSYAVLCVCADLISHRDRKLTALRRRASFFRFHLARHLRPGCQAYSNLSVSILWMTGPPNSRCVTVPSPHLVCPEDDLYPGRGRGGGVEAAYCILQSVIGQ